VLSIPGVGLTSAVGPEPVVANGGRARHPQEISAYDGFGESDHTGRLANDQIQAQVFSSFFIR
jgi:hypothetical protein